jgi:1-deoxy-D-xylulose-5-phosphate reductoisomerase
MARRVVILGSTGSIGTQALEVIAHLNSITEDAERRFEVVGLVAGRNRELLEKQAAEFGVADARCAADSASAAEDMVREVECDIVVAAIVGSAGIRATLAAAELGRQIALANKESLVAAGALITSAAHRSKAGLLPIDSEHAGLWQCLMHARAKDAACVARAIITASGGPFRTWGRAQIWDALPHQALKHPTWSMGPKVTVDCASLMNKGLELIEAHWLFSLPAAKLETVVHPQSIVHAMLEFEDGNVICQLAAPDMRTPIQHALAYPWRLPSTSRRMDWAALRALEFEPVDHERFPLLRLAYRAIEQGGTAGAILNAANEAAVRAFLASGEGATPMRFGRVIEAVLETVEAVKPAPMKTLEDCAAAEAAASEYVERLLG